MKKLMKCACGLAVAMFFVAAYASADLIADWTFETSLPTSAGPISPESGTGTGTASTGATYSHPTGDGSLSSWSSNGWDIGDWWKFQVATTGYSAIQLDWDQTGSNTGPRDFNLQYSTDDSTYTTFGSTLTVLPSISVGTRTFWTAGTYFSDYHFHVSLTSLDGTIDDKSAVYFRLVDNSTTSLGNGTVSPAGTDRVDNFTVSGTLIPEPSTVMLVGLGLAGLVAIRRRRS